MPAWNNKGQPQIFSTDRCLSANGNCIAGPPEMDLLFEQAVELFTGRMGSLIFCPAG
jgi:hypothetical protein